jgi:DNA invertase Pin-like site-specific DNA recombinase
MEDLQEEFRRQEAAIASECERRGLILLRVVHERDTRRRPLERPGLGYALERIAAGEADGLVVSELSRVTHSAAELGGVLEWLLHHGARFVAAAPPGVDTADEAGRLTVQTIIQVSRWEHRRLVERTRNGILAARRNGPASVSDDPELTERIAGMRAAGMTLQAIADQLNASGIPTVRGGTMWRPSSVQGAVGYQRPSAGRALELRPRLARAKAEDA